MNSKNIVLVGSNHSASINKQLTLSLLKDFPEFTFIDIEQLNVPMYDQDTEVNDGFPQSIIDLVNQLKNAERIWITTNEHNSNISAFLKNIIDWISRYDKLTFSDKKMLVVSTSNGKRGGLGANEYLTDFLKRNGAIVEYNFVFPQFSQNFDIQSQQITNDVIKEEFISKIKSFLNS